jgi:hypothetical protein
MAGEKGRALFTPRVRALVAVAGIILIGIGVYATFQAEQDAASATTVGGGIVLLLIAAVGGLLKLKFGDLEAVFAESGEGDDELAGDLLKLLFKQGNPDAEQYRQQAIAAVQQAATAMGTKAKPVAGVTGLDAVVEGSLIGVDVRAGPSFVLDRVYATYAVLLDPQLPVVDGLVTVVRADPDNRSVRALGTLTASLGGPIEAVAWRPGDSHEPIRQALDRILTQVRDRSRAAATGTSAPSRTSETQSAARVLRERAEVLRQGPAIEVEGIDYGPRRRMDERRAELLERVADYQEGVLLRNADYPQEDLLVEAARALVHEAERIRAQGEKPAGFQRAVDEAEG